MATCWCGQPPWRPGRKYCSRERYLAARRSKMPPCPPCSRANGPMTGGAVRVETFMGSVPGGQHHPNPRDSRCHG